MCSMIGHVALYTLSRVADYFEPNVIHRHLQYDLKTIIETYFFKKGLPRLFSYLFSMF